MDERRVELAEFAAKVFPFRHWIRTAPVEAGKRFGLPAERMLPLIDQALVDDPYSAELIARQMSYRLALNDPEGATESFRRLQRDFPRSYVVRDICGERKDCKVQFVARQQ